MKYLATALLALTLTGCSLLPRAYDPVMFGQLVVLSLQVEQVDCDRPNWQPVVQQSQALARYTDWREDPQADNLAGLHKHVERMNQGGSKTFCELGKRTAAGRISAARTAWEGR
jgi:hypothetical protein